MSYPNIIKIILNLQIGKISKLNEVIREFQLISNQKPYLIKSKKASISFKCRRGITSGLKATIRGKSKDNFIEILRYLFIPNFRNFKGFKKSCCNGKDINIGLKDIDNSPHLTNSNIQFIKGLNVHMVTNGDPLEIAKKDLNLPFI